MQVLYCIWIVLGEKGDTGDKGDIGTKGNKGLKGTKGYIGEEGLQGPEGKRKFAIPRFFSAFSISICFSHKYYVSS